MITDCKKLLSSGCCVPRDPRIPQRLLLLPGSPALHLDLQTSLVYPQIPRQPHTVEASGRLQQAQWCHAGHMVANSGIFSLGPLHFSHLWNWVWIILIVILFFLAQLSGFLFDMNKGDVI